MKDSFGLNYSMELVLRAKLGCSFLTVIQGYFSNSPMGGTYLLIIDGSWWSSDDGQSSDFYGAIEERDKTNDAPADRGVT